MADQSGEDTGRPDLDRYGMMFGDVLRALQKRVGHRLDLIPWLDEHEPFIAEKISEGQDLIADAYKAKIPIEEFAELVKTKYWDFWKKGIFLYDRYIESTREKRQGSIGH